MARITYQDLLTMAKSGNADERKRGYALFNAWVRSAPRLEAKDQLTKMERDILQQIFATKGFKVERK